MPSWINDAYTAVNNFLTDNPSVTLLLSALLIPVGNWLYKAARTLGTHNRLQRLASELDQLKQYQSEDKTPHLAGVLDSFLSTTLLLAVSEVCLYYVSEFAFTKAAPLDVFAYFYLLMIYSYAVLQISRRLRRIMRPEAYITRLEKKIVKARTDREKV